MPFLHAETLHAGIAYTERQLCFILITLISALLFVHSFVRSVNRATESSAHFFAPVKV